LSDVLTDSPTDALALARTDAASGRLGQAIARLADVVRRTPDAEAAFTLGVYLLGDGRAEEALAPLRQAATWAPRVAAVFVNLSTAAIRCGYHDEAVEAARRAVSLDHDLPDAHGVLGNALSAKKDHPAAETAYRAAAMRAPQSPIWLINLGHCLLDLHDAGAAHDAFRRALALTPKNHVALNGEGLAYQQEDRHSDAIASFEAALSSVAEHAEAWGNLAVSLQCLGRHEEALGAARRALDLRGSSEAAQNVGHIFQSLGRHGEAIAAYERALERDPQARGIHAYLLHSRRHECIWTNDDNFVRAVRAAIDSGEVVPPFALASTDIGPALRLRAARRSAQTHEPRDGSPQAPRAEPKDRLRIGFVSPDFKTHSLGMSFAALLEAPRDFEWIGYSTRRENGDSMTAAIAHGFDALHEIGGLGTDEAAARIREDGIDVLVDLAGHTRGGALDLFARVPAPVQAHYLGYGSTLGARYIPWLITDRVHTPPGLAHSCSEAIAYLPRSFMAAAWTETGNAPRRSDEGLPDTGTVFACFNAHYKIEPTAFANWMHVLAAVPDSVLWLRQTNERVAGRLRETARACGIDPQRLIFAPRRDRQVHLARHQLADLCLDTFNHGGGVTTIDAILAGTPVVTWAGTTQTARTGVSILQPLGLPELVCATPADYVATAIRLGSDPAALSRLRNALRTRAPASPLFDSAALANALNQAFRVMHDRAAAGLAPETFDVSPLH
jgi:protein O-GlcNAc transferase